MVDDLVPRSRSRGVKGQRPRQMSHGPAVGLHPYPYARPSHRAYHDGTDRSLITRRTSQRHQVVPSVKRQYAMTLGLPTFKSNHYLFTGVLTRRVPNDTRTGDTF